MSDEGVFNLEHTARIDELCQVPQAARDEAWIGALFCYLPTASLATTDTQVFTGPDGFPYFELHLPKPGSEFTSFSIAHILPYVTENGFGVALNPRADGGEPDWVFTFGDLWNFRESGEFLPKQPRWEGGARVGASDEARSILIGSPSESLLPKYVRQAVARVLQSRFRIDAPGVFLMEDDKLTPSLNLVFNVFEEDFASKEEFDYARTYLSWSMPRDYGLLGISKSSQLAERFQPLVG